MRKIACLGMAVGLLATTAWAQNPPQRPAARAQAPSTLRLLSERIPELTFQDLPLDQVMEWLSEFTKLNISVRWQMLADAGIERDRPISIQARNLTVSQVLWLIMNEAAGSDLKLAYRASGNLLILSTEEDLNREMITKIYDVADLLVSLPRAQRQGRFDVTQGLGQNTGVGGGGGGGGAASGMFGQGQGGQYNQQQDQQNQDNEATLQNLIDLIQQTIEPDSWRINNGPGTIFPFQRSIIVRNTIMVHQRLGGYLSEDEVGGR